MERVPFTYYRKDNKFYYQKDGESKLYPAIFNVLDHFLYPEMVENKLKEHKKYAQKNEYIIKLQTYKKDFTKQLIKLNIVREYIYCESTTVTSIQILFIKSIKTIELMTLLYYDKELGPDTAWPCNTPYDVNILNHCIKLNEVCDIITSLKSNMYFKKLEFNDHCINLPHVKELDIFLPLILYKYTSIKVYFDPEDNIDKFPKCTIDGTDLSVDIRGLFYDDYYPKVYNYLFPNDKTKMVLSSQGLGKILDSDQDYIDYQPLMFEAMEKS